MVVWAYEEDKSRCHSEKVREVRNRGHQERQRQAEQVAGSVAKSEI